MTVIPTCLAFLAVYTLGATALLWAKRYERANDRLIAALRANLCA